MICDGFRLQNATLLDLPSIWRLERQCFESDAYDIVSLFGLAIAYGTLKLKAVADRRLVGYLAGEVHRSERTGWIVTVGVYPEYQGRGIGRSLIARAESEFLPHVRVMKLTVRRSNARAISLYGYCGYHWAGTANGYYHDGEDGLIMVKNLTAA